jgi:hypothetical protein
LIFSLYTANKLPLLLHLDGKEVLLPPSQQPQRIDIQAALHQHYGGQAGQAEPESWIVLKLIWIFLFTLSVVILVQGFCLSQLIYI